MADGDSRNTSGIAPHEAPERLDQPGLPCLDLREITQEKKNDHQNRSATQLHHFL